MKRNSRQSEPVKAAIVAKRTIGESKAKIAKDLQICESTVTDVLDSCDFKELIQDGKIRVMRMIPKACIAFDQALDEGDVSVATTVLKGCGVLETEQQANLSASVTFVCHIEEPIREVKQA